MKLEVIMLLIGALISFIASIGILFIERLIQRRGKIKIYYKFVNHSHELKGWGFGKDNMLVPYLIIPTQFEIQNTSNYTRVIRDVNILLFDDNKFVDKTIQIQKFTNEKKTGNKVKEVTQENFGTINNSYSFILPALSIQKQNCCFLYEYNPNIKFNKIVLSYYDEKDKQHTFFLRDLPVLWEERFPADDDWILLE